MSKRIESKISELVNTLGTDYSKEHIYKTVGGKYLRYRGCNKGDENIPYFDECRIPPSIRNWEILRRIESLGLAVSSDISRIQVVIGMMSGSVFEYRLNSRGWSKQYNETPYTSGENNGIYSVYFEIPILHSQIIHGLPTLYQRIY